MKTMLRVFALLTGLLYSLQICLFKQIYDILLAGTVDNLRVELILLGAEYD